MSEVKRLPMRPEMTLQQVAEACARAYLESGATTGMLQIGVAVSGRPGIIAVTIMGLVGDASGISDLLPASSVQ